MRTAIIVCVTLLLATTSSAQFLAQESNVDPQDVYQILKGVIEGVQAESHLDIDSIVACIHDSESIYIKVAKAVQLIQTNEFDNVKEGIKLIGEALQALPNAIEDCKASEAELIALAKVLNNLLEQLRHPLRFAFTIGKNLILNGADIYREINVAVNDWNSQQYEDFGFQIGTILVQLLERMENLDAVIYDNQVIVTVFDGVLDGIVDASGIRAEDFKVCIRSVQEVVIDFEEAVRLLETGKAANVIEALAKFGEGLEELPEAIDACEAPTVEVITLAKKLRSLIQSLSSPQSFAFHIGKDLIVNGKDIYREVFTAVDDWKAGNWYDYGFQLGKAMFQIFVGLEEMQ